MRAAKAFLDISIDGQEARRIEIKLFDKTHPKTVENFKALCTGVVLKKKEGKGDDEIELDKEYSYKGCKFHRVI